MPEPPAVIVLELNDGRDLERTLQILGVVRLPEHNLHAAVADSARQVLDVFADAVPGSDARRDVPSEVP
jgi:hypothetical protein